MTSDKFHHNTANQVFLFNLITDTIFKTLAILFKYDKKNCTYFKIKCI